MLICVTNRKLCPEDFLSRIERLAQAKPAAVLLREKDLAPAAYEQLAVKVKAICDHYGVPVILHQHSGVAEKLAAAYLQLSMPALRVYKKKDPALLLGASVHSVDEAVEAQTLGAAYLVAGHIYATDCKKGLAPRGLDFLRQVCQAVNLPVFAIGGISSSNVQAVLASGAAGVCVMSEAMTCQEPMGLVQGFTAKVLCDKKYFFR